MLSRHKSEGVRCPRGPLATVGVASMAMANTIAVTRNVMRAVAVVILLGTVLGTLTELYIYLNAIKKCKDETASRDIRKNWRKKVLGTRHR